MLWKRKSKLVQGETQVSPTPITVIDDLTVRSKKPKTKYKIVSYTSMVDGLTYTGVVLDTLIYEKSKSPTTRNVYVISVFKNNRTHKLIPQLKWVNSIYCTEVNDTPADKIPLKYFQYDWMVEDAKTKRLQKLRTEKSLQESDGGEISA